MRKKLLNVFQYLFFLGLGLFLIWYSVKDLTKDELSMMKNALRNANFYIVIPGLIISFSSHYSRALRWKMLMKPLDFQPSNSNTFYAVILGYFFNLFVPRLGEVMKCTVLAKYEKTPVDKLIGTMVAERAFDFICLLIVFVLTIVLQIDFLGNFVSQKIRDYFSSLELFSWSRMFILIICFFGFTMALRYVLVKYAHIKHISKIKNIIKGIWDGLISIRKVEKKGLFLFHSLFIWFTYLMGMRISFYAMDSISHLGILPSFTLLSFGSIAMIVTQGGIGAYQLAIQKALHMYGISEVIGLAFGWLMWIIQTGSLVVAGVISLILMPLSNRKKKDYV